MTIVIDDNIILSVLNKGLCCDGHCYTVDMHISI
jgi:hypothetical protein